MKLHIFDFLVQTDKKANTWGKWYEVDLADAKFGNADELCLVLNEHIWKHIGRVRDANVSPFTYSKEMKRIWFNYNKGEFYLILVKGYLLRMTGLTERDDPSRIVPLGKSKRKLFYKFGDEIRRFDASCRNRFKSLNEGRNYAKREPLIADSRWNEFIIYSNLVSLNFFGSEKINHLRCVPLQDKNTGKVVTKTFESRFYFPTALSYISDAKIELRQFSGSFVPLQGNTRVVLHFRRKKD